MLHYYDKYYIISLKLSNNALKNFKVSLRKGEKSMKKEFILRTEAVLSSEKATMAFGGDNDVTIPMAILENLYQYKGIPEKMVIANRVIDYIQDLDMAKISSSEGVKQSNGSILRVIDNTKIDKIIEDMNNLSTLDKRVFQVCLDRQKATRNQVILISQNPSIRIKAKMLGIESQPFKDEIFPLPKNQYTGKIEVFVSQTILDKFNREKSIKINDVYNYNQIEWFENMFVVMKSETNASCLGRYSKGNIVSLRYGRKSELKTLNVEQEMLAECIAAPSEIAPLVVIKGAAGTGKTFCTLSIALNKIRKFGDEGIYDKVLIATPTVNIDEEIGYLPGNIDDKVSTYLGGIMDNLRNHFKMCNEDADNNLIEGQVSELFDRQYIEIQGIGFLRGRSIKDNLFIIDEAQNIRPEILLDIVTRVGKGTKIVLMGDPTQVNRVGLNVRRNGLVYISEKMKGSSLCWQVTLNNEKSVRSELAQEALRILQNS